jgi:putative phosphoribosyl transferase
MDEADQFSGAAVKAAYRDRSDAGRRLVEELDRYRGRDDLIVLGLSRGGVPVAYEVAKALGAPLDVFLVRKLRVPGHEELAIGALASGGYRFVNEEVVQLFGVAPDLVDDLTTTEQAELDRQEHEYREDRPFPDVAGKTVIVVDDGLATGASMRAAVSALRGANPAQIVVAVPVAAPDVCDFVAEATDDIICAITPQPFFAVGVWYEDFSETTDDEVKRLLRTTNAEGNEQRG